MLLPGEETQREDYVTPREETRERDPVVDVRYKKLPEREKSGEKFLPKRSPPQKGCPHRARLKGRVRSRGRYTPRARYYGEREHHW